jgi:hypothetical protein
VNAGVAEGVRVEVNRGVKLGVGVSVALGVAVQVQDGLRVFVEVTSGGRDDIARTVKYPIKIAIRLNPQIVSRTRLTASNLMRLLCVMFSSVKIQFPIG